MIHSRTAGLVLLILAACVAPVETRAQVESRGDTTYGSWFGGFAAPVYAWHDDVPVVIARHWGIPEQTIDADGFGIGGGVMLDRPLGATWGIVARLGVVQTSASGGLKGIPVRTRLRTFGHEPDVYVDSVVPIDVTVECETVLVDAAVTYRQDLGSLGDTRFSIEAGPKFSIVAELHYLESIELGESTPNAGFANEESLPSEVNGRRLIVFDDKVPGGIAMRPGVTGGISMRGPIGRKQILSAALLIDVPLITVIESSGSWRAYAVALNVGWTWGL